MKVVIQKCKDASVSVDNKLINKIDSGLCILVGISVDDTSSDVSYMVNKVLNLRIFDDENNVMNKSILDVGGEILSISQFTLQADTRKGNRPSYINAMKGEDAINLYEEFNRELNKSIKTYPGVFGADMLINILNDGPTTIIIDSKKTA
ncbi:MAG TPA: D-aminoacyl-tRNA deacylase [Bacilli bacterium]|nr:D-aminoacyl-tRNA deacylase [Bacilli bacterium]HQC83435.1 D-aminoacyl-tRNA deacylase [Bacilli bacterium]